MSNVAIVYWSGTGNTEAMADFVAEGVEAKGGAATIIQAADFGVERVPEFDAFAFGARHGRRRTGRYRVPAHVRRS